MNLVGKEYRLPNKVIALIVFLCALPAIFNYFGIDFGLPHGLYPLERLSKLSFAEFENEIYNIFDGDIVFAFLDWAAITIALCTVLLVFFHYSFSKNALVFLLGVMLLFRGISDAFHSIFANHLIDTVLESERFIPLAWVVSQTVRVGSS